MRNLSKILLFILFIGLLTAQQVKIDGKPLFTIERPSGELSQSERSERANTFLDSLSADLNFSPDSIKLEKRDENYYISAKERTILVVSPEDTFNTGLSQVDVANRWIGEIRDGITEHRSKSINWKNIIKFALMVLYPVFLIIIFILLHKLSIAFSKYVMSQEGKFVKGIKFGKVQILTPVRETKIILRFIIVLKYVAFALILYFSLLLFLAQFPQTEKYVLFFENQMQNFILFIEPFVYGLFRVVIGALVLYILMKLLIALLNYIGRNFSVSSSFSGNLTQGGFEALVNTLKKFVVVLFFLGVIYIIPGGDTLAFVLLIIMLIVIGLAFVSIIRDFIAGYILMLKGLYQEGDFINVGEFKGKVHKRSFLFTEFELEDRSHLYLHNSLILSKPIIVRAIDEFIQTDEEKKRLKKEDNDSDASENDNLEKKGKEGEHEQ